MDISLSPSVMARAYVDNAVLDGTNTDGEYDDATKVMLNSYGNDTDGDNMRIIYTDEAIYVLVEVFDNTVVNYSDTVGGTKAGSSKADTVFLGFSIGNAFQGIKSVYRGGAGRTTFQPESAYVDVTAGYGTSGALEEKYFAHVNNEENGFTLEARFPVSEMSAYEQALYAAGQLELRFTAGTQDGTNAGTEFTVTYDGDTANRGWNGAAEDDYFVPSFATSYKAKNPSNYPEYKFEFVSDEVVEVPAVPTDYMAYVANPTLDGKNTNGEYDNAYSIPFAEGLWGATATGNESLKVVYSDDAIYVYLESKDDTDNAVDDFLVLFYNIGNSYNAVLKDHRTNATSLMTRGETGFTTGWALPSYIIKTVTDEVIAFEAKFAVADMTAEDQEAFANGTLSVEIAGLVCDNWHVVATEANVYGTSAYNSISLDTYNAVEATPLTFAEKGEYEDNTANISLDYMAYASNPTLDGANTNGEYDNTYTIPFATPFWGAPSGNETIKVIYSDNAIYFFFEAIDDEAASDDFMGLNFRVGSSYVGYLQFNRLNSSACSSYNNAGTVEMATEWMVRKDRADGWAAEIMFPVSDMTEEDKAAFAAGTLDVGFSACYIDGWGSGKNGSSKTDANAIYSLSADAYTKATALTFAEKGKYEDKTENFRNNYMAYVSYPTLDGVNTNGEYDNTYTILFDTPFWGTPSGNETIKVIYSDNAIYFLFEAIDDVATADDFMGLNFRVGSSYVGYLQFNRLNSSVSAGNDKAGEVEVSSNWLRRVDGTAGWTVEIMFPVSEMTADDKAAFEAGTLDVGFSACYVDNWGSGKNGSSKTDANAIYSLSADAYTKATALEFAAKGDFKDPTEGMEPENDIPYVANPFLDGVNTNGEYDNALDIPLNTVLWGSPSGKETFRVIYTDTAIYVYFESIDDELSAADFIYLNYKIGSSYIGTTQHNAAHNSSGTGWDANTKVGGTGTLQEAWFKKNITATGWSIEGRFLVERMNAEDKAAFEAGTLEVGFSLAYCDNWGSGKNGSAQTIDGAYNNKNTADAPVYDMVLGKKGATQDTTGVPFESEITFDGSNTNDEYKNAYYVPFHTTIWGSPYNVSGNESFKILYTEDAIYLLFESIDDHEISDTNPEDVDFIYFNIKIGTSFFGTKLSIRTDAGNEEGAVDLGGTANLVDGQSKYFKKSNTAEGWSVEIRFPVADMNEEDKAAFAAKTLEIAFSSAYCDEWGAGKNGSSQTQADAYGTYGILGNPDSTAYQVKNALSKMATLKLAKPYNASFNGASITLGSDITVNYYATINADSEDEVVVKFTMNGKETLVNGILTENGKYVFVFAGVAPQCMGDNIKAELIVNGMIVDVVEEYSVLANVTSEDVLDDDTKQLVYDLLAYGAAAQIYNNYKIDALVNAGYEDLATKVDSIENSDRTLTAGLDDGKLIAAGVHFANTNKIYVKFETTDANATITINGNAVQAEADGNGYIAYSDDICATDFDEVYTIVLTTASGTQTLTYSVNAYANAKQDTANAAMAALAQALYAYGASAEAYAG